MPRKNTYSQHLIDAVHADKLAGDTLRELQRNHKLTRNQLTYILYTRRPTETPILHPDGFNNKAQKAEGSAPPSKTFWMKVKSMLGLS
jgi:hypothetical protein